MPNVDPVYDYLKQLYRLEQINTFYNPRADSRTAKKLEQQGATRPEISDYLEAQIVNFVLEFAAGVRSKSIFYQLGADNHLYYPGIPGPVGRNMYENAVDPLNPKSRENAELLGWEQIEHMLSMGAENVVQFSPPSALHADHGDYGFIFWFQQLGRNKIKTHILKYDELKGSGLQASGRMFNELFGNFGFKDEKDYLKTPVAFKGEPEELEIALKQQGLTIAEQKTNEYEIALLKDKTFSRLLQAYKLGIFNGEHIFDLRNTLLAAFERALELASLYGLKARKIDDFMAFTFMQGSCPIPGGGMANYGFGESLYYQPFECPKCHNMSYSPVGNKCPHCGITKEQWAKKLESEGKDTDICD
jgi:hypothetical protein